MLFLYLSDHLWRRVRVRIWDLVGIWMRGCGDAGMRGYIIYTYIEKIKKWFYTGDSVPRYPPTGDSVPR